MKNSIARHRTPEFTADIFILSFISSFKYHRKILKIEENKINVFRRKCFIKSK